MEKDIDYYMALPYTRELVPDPIVGWGVKIKELPNCMSQGETPEEALRMIEDAMRGWLEVELEAGDPIPEPKAEEEFSGKTVLRMPKWLHRRLAEYAEEEGMSLNQCLVSILASGVEGAEHKKLATQIEQIQVRIRNLESKTLSSRHVNMIRDDE